MTITDLSTPREKLNELSRKKKISLTAFIFVLILAGTLVPGRLVIATSDSIEHRVFFKQNRFNPDEIKKGSYVLLALYTDVRPDCRPCNISKRVSCIEGDTLSIRGDDYFCNDTLIGTAKKFSKKGHLTNPYTISGRIGKGEIFITGSHKDSYDSKYFGPRKIEDVKALLKPII